MQLLLRTGFESPGPAPDSILQHGSHGQAGTHLFIKQEVLMAVSTFHREMQHRFMN